MNTPKIEFVHFRNFDLKGQAESRGGATVAYIERGDGFEYAVARCNQQDNFNKCYGRAKAAGRLASPRYNHFTTAASRSEFYDRLSAQYNENVLG